MRTTSILTKWGLVIVYDELGRYLQPRDKRGRLQASNFTANFSYLPAHHCIMLKTLEKADNTKS